MKQLVERVGVADIACWDHLNNTCDENLRELTFEAYYTEALLETRDLSGLKGDLEFMISKIRVTAKAYNDTELFSQGQFTCKEML